jgi:hypothetical protein
MRHWICFALLAGACSGTHAAERAGENADIARFVPESKHLVSRLNTDISGDGVPDTIIVTAGDSEATVTVLLRLHGKTVDGKGRIEGLEGIDSLQVELTPLGPPTVSVRNGVLIIESLTGGSFVRTAATYRYRLDGEEGRMRLIGLDAERKSGTHWVKLSWNALTGARTIRQARGDAPSVRYGPEARATRKTHPIYMSLTPAPDELLDQALGEEKAR